MGKNPFVVTVQEVAEGLLKLNSFSPAEARNAYSGCLLVPGLGGLRFSPLLAQIKRQWSQNISKYACFWEVSPILRALAADNTPLCDLPTATLRLRLIMALRLLCLFRGIDLARLWRSHCEVGGVHYVLVRRR